VFVADVKCLEATMADCSKFADRQRQSFCLRSCCAYVAPHTYCQRKTEEIVGCLRRWDEYHQPGT